MLLSTPYATINRWETFCSNFSGSNHICSPLTPCPVRSDRQTTSLTLTTGVCYAGTKWRGVSNMNIHYDVTGLLTVVWRSHSGQIVWPAGVGQGRGGFWTHSTYTWYQGVGRQLDRWRCPLIALCMQSTIYTTYCQMCSAKPKYSICLLVM